MMEEGTGRGKLVSYEGILKIFRSELREAEVGVEGDWVQRHCGCTERTNTNEQKCPKSNLVEDGKFHMDTQSLRYLQDIRVEIVNWLLEYRCRPYMSEGF